MTSFLLYDYIPHLKCFKIVVDWTSVKQIGLTSVHLQLKIKHVSPAKTKHMFWEFDYSLWKELHFALRTGVSEGGSQRKRWKKKIEGSVISMKDFWAGTLSDLLIPVLPGKIGLKYVSVNRNGTKKLVFITTFFPHGNLNFVSFLAWKGKHDYHTN